MIFYHWVIESEKYVLPGHGFLIAVGSIESIA